MEAHKGKCIIRYILHHKLRRTDYETQIRILRSPKMMQPVIQELRAWYPNMNYSKLISQMSINRIRDRKDGKQQGTKILQVRYKDSDKKKLRRIG